VFYVPAWPAQYHWQASKRREDLTPFSLISQRLRGAWASADAKSTINVYAYRVQPDVDVTGEAMACGWTALNAHFPESPSASSPNRKMPAVMAHPTSFALRIRCRILDFFPALLHILPKAPEGIAAGQAERECEEKHDRRDLFHGTPFRFAGIEEGDQQLPRPGFLWLFDN